MDLECTPWWLWMHGVVDARNWMASWDPNQKTELGFLGHLALAGVNVLGTHLKPSKKIKWPKRESKG